MTTIRRMWSELSPEAVAKELENAFPGVAAPATPVLIDLLRGYEEVSLLDDGENFTAYRMGPADIVWICASCGHTTAFNALVEYEATDGTNIYEIHLPECY